MTKQSHGSAEQSIIQRLDARDIDGAFNAFHTLYGLAFKQWFRQRIRGEGAKDALQEFRIRVHKGLAKFRRESSVYHWAIKIAHYTWCDLLRGKNRIPARASVSVVDIAAPSLSLRGPLVRGFHGPITLLGRNLPRRYQQFLECERDDLPNKEIATKLGMSAAEVYEMRRNLRLRLQAEAYKLSWISRRPTHCNR